MDVLFVAGVSAIVRDPSAARALFGDAIGVSFEGGQGDYVFTERLPGVKHFGLWPLTQVVARLLSPDGLLVAVCWTPWFHEEGDPAASE